MSDIEDKENFVKRDFLDDLKDISVDSLTRSLADCTNLAGVSPGEEPSCGPALTANTSSCESQQENPDNPDDCQKVLTPTTNIDPLQSFRTATADSVIVDKSTDNMEFAKNYSDDLLMGGQSEGVQQGEMPPAGTDLTDFELQEQFSAGSSSGTHSPVKRKLSTSAAQPSSSAQSSSSSGGASPNFRAVKNLLLANYSKVSHVLHWKKPIETGILFTIGAALILALTFFSIISVFAYSGLGLILASSSVRAYKAIMKMLNMPSETRVDHIWNQAMSINVSLSSQKMHDLIDSMGDLNALLRYIKRVLLVEDKVAAVTTGLCLYLLTYIGAWFNFMTLIGIAYVALFSLPIIYEKNRAKIDEYMNLATKQISSVVSLVTNKVSTLSSGSVAGSSRKQD